ncbi:fatty acid desaturase [Pseudonocardia tropica]|uniref:Fatty acid desaturase n=1 Tax=Pseudonocardia tropica TaxID=681289 RepID=A0ABV1JZC4_9PSEU
MDGLLEMQLEDPEEFRRTLLDVGRRHARQMRPDLRDHLLRTLPDGAEVLTEEDLEGETRGAWYLRRLLGSANVTGNRLMHVMSGSLGYRIEHHLFPDLPSDRYPEIAVKLRALCVKYDLPYTTGPFPRQFWHATRSIWRLSLPARGIRESEHRRERRGLLRRPAAQAA